MNRSGKKPYESAFGPTRKLKPRLDFPAACLGQHCPQRYPERYPYPSEADPLGTPLSIRDVAALIGCSTWTVRQKYLPLGLPHFRVGATGKLTFYKTQVIRWVIAQQKGAK